MTRFPRNELKSSDSERENANKAVDVLDNIANTRVISLITSSDRIPLGDYCEFKINSYMKSCLKQKFNLVPHDGDDAEVINLLFPFPANRFLHKKVNQNERDTWMMGNLCFGFEIGSDVIPWWDTYPANRRRDNSEKYRRLLRTFTEGNFVYLPLDEFGKPIAYNSKKTAFSRLYEDYDLETDNSYTPNYALYLFGLSDYPGLDVWTPTGDSNMPVSLKPDGIPDGVIMVLSSMVDE
jgi:hypothetical protein